MTDHRLHFVCVGPQRTGTSWLDKYLRDHPQVALPSHVKETMFFDERFDKGMEWYWDHFTTAEPGQVVGEVAPTYFDSTDALQRLSVFEDLRIIIVIRNPIERTYSLYRHHRSKGRVPADYFEAVKLMPRIESSGRYADLCKCWESHFGSERCLYLFQHDIESDPQLVFNDLCQFLGIEAQHLPDEAGERYGASTSPTFPGIAKIAAKASTVLRSRGLHVPMEFAKRLGLKRIIFGRPAGEEPIPDQVMRHLEALHEADVRYLESRFHRSL